MKLSPIADWTSLYYDMVEHYFWEPQLIGRAKKEDDDEDEKKKKKKKKKDSHDWPHWRENLGRLEVPLNHILLQFFALAPQEMIDCALSSLSPVPLRGFHAVSPREVVQSKVTGIKTQPDFVFASPEELLFLEMKVETSSSIDQFVKYVVAAAMIQSAGGTTGTSTRLMVLVKSEERVSRVWGGELDDATLRARAEEAVGPGSESPKGELKKLLRQKAPPVDRDCVVEMIRAMPVSVGTYATMSAALRRHAATDPTAARLRDGLLAELDRRGLSDRPGRGA